MDEYIKQEAPVDYILILPPEQKGFNRESIKHELIEPSNLAMQLEKIHSFRRNKPTSEVQYICNTCKSAHETKSSLERHMRQHYLNNSSSFITDENSLHEDANLKTLKNFTIFIKKFNSNWKKKLKFGRRMSFCGSCDYVSYDSNLVKQHKWDVFLNFL